MQNGYLLAWIKEASEMPLKVQMLFEKLSEIQLNAKPAPDQWSIGELIDHIMVSNELYFPIFQRIIAGTHKAPLMARFDGVPDLFGRSILKSVEPNTEKKYKTVRKFQPVRRIFTLSKLDEFKTHQDDLIAYARKTDVVDHRKVIVRSPATPLIVYSLENAFKIILSHELRHINQAMNLKSANKSSTEKSTPI